MILKHNLITALIATLEKWRKDIKMAFNARREDHKHEPRARVGGKKW